MSELYDETVDQLAAALYSLFAVELMEWSDVDEPTKQWWRKAVRKTIDAVPGVAVVDRGVKLSHLPFAQWNYMGATEGELNALVRKHLGGYVKEETGDAPEVVRKDVSDP